MSYLPDVRNLSLQPTRTYPPPSPHRTFALRPSILFSVRRSHTCNTLCHDSVRPCSLDQMNISGALETELITIVQSSSFATFTRAPRFSSIPEPGPTCPARVCKHIRLCSTTPPPFTTHTSLAAKTAAIPTAWETTNFTYLHPIIQTHPHRSRERTEFDVEQNFTQQSFGPPPLQLPAPCHSSPRKIPVDGLNALCSSNSCSHATRTRCLNINR